MNHPENRKVSNFFFYLQCLTKFIRISLKNGWGGRDRTCEWRHQKPLPYRLATPQQASNLAVAGGLYRGNLIAQQLNRRAAPSHGCLPQFRVEYLQVLPEFAESSAPHRLRRW